MALSLFLWTAAKLQFRHTPRMAPERAKRPQATFSGSWTEKEKIISINHEKIFLCTTLHELTVRSNLNLTGIHE